MQRHGTEHNSEIERKNDEPLLYGFFVSLSQFLAQEKKKKREKKVQIVSSNVSGEKFFPRGGFDRVSRVSTVSKYSYNNVL